MIVERADVNIITHLNLKEFNKIQDRITNIQKEQHSRINIEEPFGSIEVTNGVMNNEIFSPSEIAGVGRVTIDNTFLSENLIEMTPCKLIFSKSCPIELNISFDIRFNEEIETVLTKIKTYSKEVCDALSSLLNIHTYRLGICTLYMAAMQEHVTKDKLKQLDISFRNISIVYNNTFIFKQRYPDLYYDIYFILSLGGNVDEIEISTKIEKIPIIEKIGQIIKDGLESFNNKIVNIENSLTQIGGLVQASNLDELMKLRGDYLDLKSELIRFEDMHYALGEYENIFLKPLKNVLKKENNGALQNELIEIERYYFQEIDRLLSKARKKLESAENAIDHSIETVNIKETIKLGKINLKLQKWITIVTILLFIIAIKDLFPYLVKLVIDFFSYLMKLVALVIDFFSNLRR